MRWALDYHRHFCETQSPAATPAPVSLPYTEWPAPPGMHALFAHMATGGISSTVPVLVTATGKAGGKARVVSDSTRMYVVAFGVEIGCALKSGASFALSLCCSLQFLAKERGASWLYPNDQVCFVSSHAPALASSFIC